MTTYRRFEPEDRELVDQLHREAFGDSGEMIVTMLADIRSGPHHRPSYDVVAEQDGRVVGHVLLSGTTLAGEVGTREVLQLTPLATAPDCQGCGIGTALIEHALHLADGDGEPLVLLEGAPGFYGRRGFGPAAAHGIAYPLPSWAPPEAAQVRLLSGYDASDPTLRGRVLPPAYMPEG